MTLCISNLFVIHVNVRLYANHIFDSYWTLLTLKVIISMFTVYSNKCICTSVLFLFFLSNSPSCSYRSSPPPKLVPGQSGLDDSHNGNVETCFDKYFEFLFVELNMLSELWGEWHRVSPGPVKGDVLSYFFMKYKIINY